MARNHKQRLFSKQPINTMMLGMLLAISDICAESPVVKATCRDVESISYCSTMLRFCNIRVWMKEDCEESCGHCMKSGNTSAYQDTCKDIKSSEWCKAFEKFCETTAHIKIHCAKSCGICNTESIVKVTDTCKDSRVNYCTTNKHKCKGNAKVRDRCAKTCEVCKEETGTCKDKPDYCTKYKHNCKKNAKVREQCARTCGTCEKE